MSEPSYTAEQKLDCVLRELKQRNQVYPRRVAAGKMSKQFAVEQIAIMLAIADDYRALAEKEQLL